MTRERVIEQPCCGCIFFNECGSVSKAAPFMCSKRISFDEYGGMPNRGDIIQGTNINSDNDFMCRPTRDWMD